MSSRPFLFELSGEHPDLPRAEVGATVEAECGQWREMLSSPGILVAEFDHAHFQDVASRLGLCHRAGRYLGSCNPKNAVDFAGRLEIPEGTIAVRAKRFQGGHMEISMSDLSRKIGGVLAQGRRVDLTEPEVEIRMLISEGIHFFICDALTDRTQFENRKVGMRPFFSPISLHPKFARALVNLTGVRRGERILDPFCGTGGLLLEASLMGIRVLGSDISKEMIQGCRENLEFFGARYDDLRRGDVGNIQEMFGEVDAIATDPPYGRSTTTMKEDLGELYSRMMGDFAEVLPQGKKVALVLPKPCLKSPGLRVVESHLQRVHGSLNRHYCVLVREHGP